MCVVSGTPREQSITDALHNTLISIRKWSWRCVWPHSILLVGPCQEIMPLE
jgi:hypothetical protein